MQIGINFRFWSELYKACFKDIENIYRVFASWYAFPNIENKRFRTSAMIYKLLNSL